MTEPGWDDFGWEGGGGPAPDAAPDEGERRERERRHSVRLIVLAALGAVVVALMIALVGPGLPGR